jgi:hypothetical protein
MTFLTIRRCAAAQFFEVAKRSIHASHVFVNKSSNFDFHGRAVRILPKRRKRIEGRRFSPQKTHMRSEDLVS